MDRSVTTRSATRSLRDGVRINDQPEHPAPDKLRVGPPGRSAERYVGMDARFPMLSVPLLYRSIRAIKPQGMPSRPTALAYCIHASFFLAPRPASPILMPSFPDAAAGAPAGRPPAADALPPLLRGREAWRTDAEGFRVPVCSAMSSRPFRPSPSCGHTHGTYEAVAGPVNHRLPLRNGVSLRR